MNWNLNMISIPEWLLLLKEWFVNRGLSEKIAEIIYLAVLIIIIILIAWIADIIFRQILRKLIPYLVQKSKTQWDDIFLKHRVFAAFAHFAPAIVLYFTADWIDILGISRLIQKIIIIYSIIVFLIFANAFLNALNEIYMSHQKAQEKYIKIYLQIIKVALFSFGIILVISVIFNITLDGLGKIFLSLGAFATLLLIIYKDTILGMIAGIQLTANKMLKLGDWISMQKHDADGTVIDITLTTVKVQNWDKTITTIPTYALISDSFVNWRGMRESGGRRIKRYFNVNTNSIRFLNNEEIEQYGKIELIRDYIAEKKQEIAAANKGKKYIPDQRRLTNVGTFRKYIEAYLKTNPKISRDHTFIVRQLQPGAEGLPIEIYVFSNDQKWENYEAVQANIFDHVLAVAKEFNIDIFQNPSGKDFGKIK